MTTRAVVFLLFAASHLAAGLSQPQPSLSLRKTLTSAKWRSRKFVNWAFTYANTEPYDLNSPEAVAFLATNFGFLLSATIWRQWVAIHSWVQCASLLAQHRGWYHYTQVRVGGNRQSAVQLALALDYSLASPTLALATTYATDLGNALPPSVVLWAAAAFVCLFYGCRHSVMYEQPRTFMVVHGAWHLCLQVAGQQLVETHMAILGT